MNDPGNPLHATTVCAAFQAAAATAPARTALRTLGDTVSLTWTEYAAQVRAVARGLAGLGVTKGATVATQLTNRPEFHIVDMAAAHLGALSFGLYNTAPVEEILHRLDNADCRIVVTETQFLDRVREAAHRHGTIEHIVVVDADVPGTLTLEQVKQAAPAEFDFDATWRSIRPDDLLTIIYTSGTTGRPKGAQWTHAGVMGVVRAYDDALPMPTDIVSYLPMAHAGERLMSHYMTLAYAGTVTCCPEPAQAPAHIQQAHPDFLGAPPRIWTKLRQAILARIALLDDKDAILDGIAAGVERVELEQAGSQPPAELARRHELGRDMAGPALRDCGLDRLRLGFIGSTLTPRDVVTFFHAVGIPLIEGYGLTEATGFASVWPRLDDNRIGTVGKPLTGVELRLAADGEILLRSAMNMAGYRKEPEATAAALDQDGWLHTGDIGALTDDGYLKVVDRKKELIINAYGKNMSPTNIEAAVRVECPLIAQIIAIGDGRPYNTALLTLDLETALHFAKSLDNGATTITTLADDPAIIAEVQAAVERGNRQLSRVEQIKRWTILPTEWLPDSEEMTPTLKLKRRQITTKYARDIEALYGE